MKNFLSVILYWLSILFAIICIIIPLAILSYMLYTTEINILYLGLSALPLLFLKPLMEARIKLRSTVEYDEYGVSKKNGKYERLSAKERKQADLLKMHDIERVLSSSMIKKMKHKGSIEPEKDMQKLIGLKQAKNKMEEMVARMEFQNKKDLSISSRHMCFLGNPGTGKTTLARIMTGFLYKNKYIKENKIIEIDGNFLKSSIPNDTALKTELVIRNAFGGVLFIDEAYSLLETGNGSGDAAIATLIKQMEDNRDKFILIIAGYTNEMKKLLDSNPGFKSRIKDYIVFDDYNNQEMQDIFTYMANQYNFIPDQDALDNFIERIEKERKLNSFGNGRTVRNILDESIDKHAFNIQKGNLDKNCKYKICGIDVSKDLKQY